MHGYLKYNTDDQHWLPSPQKTYERHAHNARNQAKYSMVKATAVSHLHTALQ